MGKIQMSDEEFCYEYIAAFDANPTDNIERSFVFLVVTGGCLKLRNFQ
ncbi:MAG: hypothetical protein KBT22_09445 [Bacteroidales bacterium]|nr:hypothetical protein [Candidatus Scybalocola fimicaballi]